MATYDEIQALMGAQVAPDSVEAQAQAAALRGQLNDANFLSVSTINPLQQYGQSQAKSARNTAGMRGSLNRALAKERRDRDIKQADLQDKRRYDEEQTAANRAADFANNTITNNQNYTLRQRGADNDRDRGSREATTFINPAGMEVIYDVDNKSGEVYPQGSGFDAEPLSIKGLTKKDRQGSSAYDGRNTGYMKSKEIATFEEATADYVSGFYAFDSYKPEFSQSKVLGVDTTGLPLVNSIENFASRNAPRIMNEAEIEKAQWWKDYDLFFKLPERHKLFGAALTKPEQASWNAADISKSMTPKQVQTNLTILRNLAQEKMAKMSKNVELKGGSQEYINNNIDPLMMQGYDPMGSEGFRKDTKYEVSDDVITVTMAELQSLGITREEAEQDGMKVKN